MENKSPQAHKNLVHWIKRCESGNFQLPVTLVVHGLVVSGKITPRIMFAELLNSTLRDGIKVGDSTPEENSELWDGVLQSTLKKIKEEVSSPDYAPDSVYLTEVVIHAPTGPIEAGHWTGVLTSVDGWLFGVTVHGS